MDSDFEKTASRIIAMDLIAFCIASKTVLIFQGAAGVGKTKLIDIASRSFKQKQKIQINMSKNTEICDLMGRYIPNSDGTCTF